MRWWSLIGLVLAGCPAPEPQPMPPPSAEYVGTWKSRDDSVRLVFTNDGKVQYTKGKWTNTGLIVAWNEAGFEISAYPKPEQHTVKGPPHEKDGYNWLTVDDAELFRSTTTAEIGVPAPPKPPVAPEDPPPAPVTVPADPVAAPPGDAPSPPGAAPR